MQPFPWFGQWVTGREPVGAERQAAGRREVRKTLGRWEMPGFQVFSLLRVGVFLTS
jgi:hypothetical protein